MKYRTIVADPPWRYDWTSVYADSWAKTKATSLDYPSLSVHEICGLPVEGLAERDAHLYLWTTQRYLRQAYDVIEAWGFRTTPSILVWVKPPRGFVGTYACNTEFVLRGERGSLKAKGKVGRNWWEWPRTAHSAKPDAFLDIVESVSPGPYVELFARRARFGWDYWGDESLGTAQLG